MAGEYWMIYRGPGCFTVIWFRSSPTPFSPPPPISKLALFLSLPVCRLPSLLTGDGGGGQGTKSCDLQESLALYKPFNTLCTWLSSYRRLPINPVAFLYPVFTLFFPNAVVLHCPRSKHHHSSVIFLPGVITQRGHTENPFMFMNESFFIFLA